jgi:hypothetical protein
MQKFPYTSEAKIKEGIFIGPEVTQLFQDLNFKNKLNAANIRARDAFDKACSNFLGNKKMRKIRRNYGGATFPILCLGVQHVIATPFPAIPTGFFPGKYGSCPWPTQWKVPS